MRKPAAKAIPSTTVSQHLAVVSFVDDEGPAIEVDGTVHRAVLSPQLFNVAEGQRVLAVDPGFNGDWLIVAAWPVHGRTSVNALDFDAATGSLRIQAPHIDLMAVASIELSCGATRIRLSVDGQVKIEGQEVLSSAIGAHRIEGATIDMN